MEAILTDLHKRDVKRAIKPLGFTSAVKIGRLYDRENYRIFFGIEGDLSLIDKTDMRVIYTTNELKKMVRYIKRNLK